MKPLVPALIAALLALAACGPNEPRAKAVLALAGDPARGAALYDQTCAHCHQNRAGWSMVLSLYGPTGFVSTLIDGVPKTKMPSFAAWSDQQLADVYAYVRSLKKD